MRPIFENHIFFLLACVLVFPLQKWVAKVSGCPGINYNSIIIMDLFAAWLHGGGGNYLYP